MKTPNIPNKQYGCAKVIYHLIALQYVHCTLAVWMFSERKEGKRKEPGKQILFNLCQTKSLSWTGFNLSSAFSTFTVFNNNSVNFMIVIIINYHFLIKFRVGDSLVFWSKKVYANFIYFLHEMWIRTGVCCARVCHNQITAFSFSKMPLNVICLSVQWSYENRNARKNIRN